MNLRTCTHPASSRGYWLAGAAAGLASLGALSDAQASALTSTAIPCSADHLAQLPQYTFRHDFVLGTSMELTVQADGPAAALACQHAVLAEIDRLNRILSIYEPDSAINRAKAGLADYPPELTELLSLYADWHRRTDGAINPHMAGLITCWKQAGRDNALPSDGQLESAMQPVGAALSSDSIYSRGLSLLNVDALGKGFIIDRAVAVARKIAPGGLLNIGGDMRAWGDATWRIGIADPGFHAENAEPVAWFDLTNAAAATSGGYLRYSTIQGRKYSHVIDPRTLMPTRWDISATVVASDCVSANALSTSACVLGAQDGMELAQRHLASGYFFADTRGVVAKGGAGASPVKFADAAPAGAAPAHAAFAAAAAADAWPKGYSVNIDVALAAGGGGRYRRPYVAIWIEDAKANPVRSISLWGNQNKYVRDLSFWWKATNGGKTANRNIAMGTKNPGKYSVAWDGMDDAGKPLPRGDYTVIVEITREHGGHVKQSAKITCGDKAATATLSASGESEESTVTFGPKGGK